MLQKVQVYAYTLDKHFILRLLPIFSLKESHLNTLNSHKNTPFLLKNRFTFIVLQHFTSRQEKDFFILILAPEKAGY